MSVGPFPDRPRIGITSWKRAVRTLVGDPEDLFTLAEEYVDGVRRAGGLPFILPPAPLSAAPETVRSLDGLLLTGGGDFAPSCYTTADEGVSSDIDPEEDAWDIALTVAAREAGVPLVGICRGMQALNLALGGTLEQDISERPNHPPIPDTPEHAVAYRHPVTIVPGSRLGRILGVTERGVNSIHHQAVERLGDGLVAVAHAPDGTIEGLEYRGDDGGDPDGAGPEADGWFALAVQWHPERMEHGVDQHIFEDLVERAGTRRAALSRSESR